MCIFRRLAQISLLSLFEQRADPMPASPAHTRKSAHNLSSRYCEGDPMLCVFPGPVGDCKAYLQKMSVEGGADKSESSFIQKVFPFGRLAVHWLASLSGWKIKHQGDISFTCVKSFYPSPDIGRMCCDFALARASRSLSSLAFRSFPPLGDMS